MAMYAYLMSLVVSLYADKRESQKKVIEYISKNCSRVGIQLQKSQCNRPGPKTGEEEDQFTAWRNKLAHPSNLNKSDTISEDLVNQLAAIICCAVEDTKI